jgi:glycosyltransferase involved in cell wall biosynthesis
MGVSDSVLEHYTQETERRLVVRSCAPSWFADGPAADVCGAGRTHFSVIHGKFGLDNGTDKVLEAMALTREEDKRLRVIMFATRDPTADAAMKKLNAMAQDRRGDGTLDLRKSVPLQEMPAVIRSCDLGLIAYGRSFGLDSLPNRLFEYMAAGVPVVAPAYSREIARIVTAEECGVLADFEDPHSIASTIVELARNPERCREMGRRGRKAFLERHNWDVEVQPLLERIRNWYK